MYIVACSVTVANFIFDCQNGAEGYDLRDGLDLDIKDNGTYSTYMYTQRAQDIIRQHNQSQVSSENV